MPFHSQAIRRLIEIALASKSKDKAPVTNRCSLRCLIVKTNPAVNSGRAGPHISCDCFSTFHSRFCQVVHGL